MKIHQSQKYQRCVVTKIRKQQIHKYIVKKTHKLKAVMCTEYCYRIRYVKRKYKIKTYDLISAPLQKMRILSVPMSSVQKWINENPENCLH